MSVGCALSAGILAYTFHNEIEVAVTPRTEQEVLLSDTLASSIVGVKAKADCQEGLSERVGSYGRVHSIVPLNTIPAKIIYLDQQVCDDAESYIGSEQKYLSTHKQTLGIIALEHEGYHLKFDTGDEPATACRAYQTIECRPDGPYDLHLAKPVYFPDWN